MSTDKDYVIPPELQPAPLPQAANPALARNIAAAQSEFATNQITGFQDQLGRLKRATVNRDATSAGRDHYNRVHAETVKFAERVATITGKSQLIPRYLPAPNVTVEYQSVEVPAFDPGFYPETGSGKKSTGVQPDFSRPESDAHQAWLSTQSVPPVDTTGKSPADVTAARKARADVK